MTLFSEKQMTNMTYHESLDDAMGWLDELVSVHDIGDGKPYYLHIDHMQILPAERGKFYPLLTVYHRVYLQKG